ncbi:MAG: hypothetical protein IJO28_09010 [Oscillospiraceae bacterium]|nr:hypothetical protein [Oscillospiraceae bacterium]
MTERFIDCVYETVIGQRCGGARVPGVEDAFAPGGLCDQCYESTFRAYDRLRDRLDVEDEDEDVECILDNLRIIEKEVAYQMYRYGVSFGKEDFIDVP